MTSWQTCMATWNLFVKFLNFCVKEMHKKHYVNETVCRLDPQHQLSLFSIYLNSGQCFSLALIVYSNSGYPVLFTSQRPQTRVSYEQKAFRFAAVTSEEAVPDKTKKAMNFYRQNVCLFNLNLSIKPVKKFLVYKCKLSLTF